jgi:hypothetical protein
VLVGDPEPDALARALHEDVVQLGRLGLCDAHDQAVELRTDCR